MASPRFHSVRSPQAMVASADQLATQAGLRALALGGNAVDAAIATNAAIAVTGPHLCGMGGDLFALVHRDGEVLALNATGRAGAGADAAALRAEGHVDMPFRHDIRTRHRARLRRRLGGAARALRPPAAVGAARAGDRAGRRRLPGQPAARRRRAAAPTKVPARTSPS